MSWGFVIKLVILVCSFILKLKLGWKSKFRFKVQSCDPKFVERSFKKQDHQCCFGGLILIMVNGEQLVTNVKRLDGTVEELTENITTLA